ncbi:MAG: DUF1501 domain-containing protein [Gemmataceae bacterium]|nr:DUF1501 domain-containing protein [Gemmataceae bacterium]
MHNTHFFWKNLTRRTFLGKSGIALGSIALTSMLHRDIPTTAKDNTQSLPTTPEEKKPLSFGKAKSVIFLHMAGAPSQLDLFDPKPTLVRFSGKPCPEEYLKGKRFAFIRGVPNLLGSPYRFQQCGKSGAWLSELWKHLPKVADDITFVKGVKTDQFNHAPAQLLMHTGTSLFGGASLGSWVTYGLGSVNRDLPGFIVLSSGGRTVDAGKSIWGSGFLPSVYQGVQCRSQGDPVLFLSNPNGLDDRGRRESLDTLRELNKLHYESQGDPETQTRIEQYELAYRMQASVPKAMDLSKETRQTLELYGAVPGYIPDSDRQDDPRAHYKGNDPSFANNCLLARRLVEAGVRFVQLYDWGWDHHGVSPGEDITNTLPIKIQQIDRAISALIIDLKNRGLLDSTLVVWGGEFGRTPMQQNTAGQQFIGRDHHPYAFTMMMAGGGVKPGLSYGVTDDIGYYVREGEVDVRDIQATILHLLGLDAWKLTYPNKGLNDRLIGVEGKCRVIKEILI